MKKLVILGIGLVLCASGCSSQPKTISLSNMVIPSRADGSPHSRAEVQAAILSACRERGWVAQVRGEGDIQASLPVRRAYAVTVAIHFTELALTIAPEDTENLHGRKMERNYNRWAKNLYGTIIRNLK